METMSRNFFETAKDLFDGILRVELYHPWWWSLGLTMQYIYLRGLENFMLDLYDNPDGVHRLMAFLRDGTLHFLDKLEQKGWLTSNIGNYYVGSGGFGFTDAIKHKTKDVKCSDMWGFCESQETSSVSPEMFSEFVLPYQMPILDRFALNCYGCCEPLDGKWKYIRNIKNLRRVSVSRWADKAKMSEALGKDYIYSYKPNPSYLALKNIEEEEVRKELRSVLQLAKQNGNRLELIMKDTTTLGGSGKNLYRFSQIAKEEIEKIF